MLLTIWAEPLSTQTFLTPFESSMTSIAVPVSFCIIVSPVKVVTYDLIVNMGAYFPTFSYNSLDKNQLN